MARKKPILIKIAGLIISMTMMLSTGLSVNLPGLLRPVTTIKALAAGKVTFSESRKLTDILKDTSESEEPIRASLSTVSKATTLYEELGYSVFYTTNLESNFVIVYNSDHVDMKAVLMTPNGQKWAETYSKYLTTLSQLSGAQREYLVAVFNMDIPTGLPGSSHGQWFHVSHSSAFSTICGILNNCFTWVILHETSHCFSGSGIGFDQTLFNSGEDVYTNFRMICAFHNMNIETTKNVLVNYTARWNRTDSTLDDQYKKLERYQLKDEQYAKYFPESSVWWTDTYAADQTLAAISVQQYLASTSCGDSTYPNQFFSRLATIFNTATEKSVSFSYKHDPEECNNWMNTGAIEENWATITEDEWLKLYALCIAMPETAGLPDVGEKSVALYQAYLGRFTEKIRYRFEDKNIYTVRVTPQVLEWLRTYCTRAEDGIYFVSGALIQVFNMLDFMNADIEALNVLYRDKDFKASEATAAAFYTNLMSELNGRSFRLTKTEPAITKQPADVNAAIGETAVFAVEANGKQLSYQWQYQEGNVWKNSTASGCRTAQLSITAKNTLDGVPYRCIVTDSNGEFEISETAVFHVDVKITKQPANASVTIAQKAVFTVEASGAGTLSYQWQYYTGSAWKNSQASDAKTSSLSLNVKAEYDGYQYRCIVTSPNGTSAASEAAQINILCIAGDVNADGACTVADAVMLQKWLLSSAKLTDWRRADMNNDGLITAADLSLMKRKLLAG